MQFLRLTKYAELKRCMGIDHKFIKKSVTKEVVGTDANGAEVKETVTEIEGLFELDKNGKNIYIGASSVTEIDGELSYLTLDITPKAGKYDALFVELSPGAVLLGAICTTTTLKDGESPEVFVKSGDGDAGKKLLELDWIVKCCGIKGVKS